MANEIVSADNGLLLPAQFLAGNQYSTDEIFDIVAKAGNWTPSMRLYGSNSDVVKSGAFPMNHYGVYESKDKILDLGESVDVLPVCWRARAMRLTSPPISVYDPASPEFEQIMKDSEESDSKCVYGPEYLLWLFGHKKFVLFLMGSATARREARNLKPLLGRAATLKWKLASNASYKWQAPVVIPCSKPYTVEDAPSTEQVELEREKFNNPQQSEVEFSPEAAEAETARAR